MNHLSTLQAIFCCAMCDFTFVRAAGYSNKFEYPAVFKKSPALPNLFPAMLKSVLLCVLLPFLKKAAARQISSIMNIKMNYHGVVF
jgi:hypothetical protein